jgi:hypothetical protein
VFGTLKPFDQLILGDFMTVFTSVMANIPTDPRQRTFGQLTPKPPYSNPLFKTCSANNHIVLVQAVSPAAQTVTSPMVTWHASCKTQPRLPLVRSFAAIITLRRTTHIRTFYVELQVESVTNVCAAWNLTSWGFHDCFRDPHNGGLVCFNGLVLTESDSDVIRKGGESTSFMVISWPCALTLFLFSLVPKLLEHHLPNYYPSVSHDHPPFTS